jgi:hypothetical protein
VARRHPDTDGAPRRLSVGFLDSGAQGALAVYIGAEAIAGIGVIGIGGAVDLERQARLGTHGARRDGASCYRKAGHECRQMDKPQGSSLITTDRCGFACWHVLASLAG